MDPKTYIPVDKPIAGLSNSQEMQNNKYDFHYLMANSSIQKAPPQFLSILSEDRIIDDDDLIFEGSYECEPPVLSTKEQNLLFTAFQNALKAKPSTTSTNSSSIGQDSLRASKTSVQVAKQVKSEMYEIEEPFFKDFDDVTPPQPPVFDERIEPLPGSLHRPILPIDTLFPTDDIMFQAGSLVTSKTEKYVIANSQQELPHIHQHPQESQEELNPIRAIHQNFPQPVNTYAQPIPEVFKPSQSKPSAPKIQPVTKKPESIFQFPESDPLNIMQTPSASSNNEPTKPPQRGQSPPPIEKPPNELFSSTPPPQQLFDLSVDEPKQKGQINSQIINQTNPLFSPNMQSPPPNQFYNQNQPPQQMPKPNYNPQIEMPNPLFHQQQMPNQQQIPNHPPMPGQQMPNFFQMPNQFYSQNQQQSTTQYSKPDEMFSNYSQPRPLLSQFGSANHNSYPSVSTFPDLDTQPMPVSHTDPNVPQYLLEYKSSYSSNDNSDSQSYPTIPKIFDDDSPEVTSLFPPNSKQPMQRELDDTNNLTLFDQPIEGSLFINQQKKKKSGNRK